MELDADVWVVNPAWREIDKVLKKQRNSLAHLRRKWALEPAPRFPRARALDAQIQACDRAIEGLVPARKAADHHVRAGQVSESERLQAPSAAAPADGHPACMIAYRAETAMAAAVAPELDNPDTARSLPKSLFRGDASLHPDKLPSWPRRASALTSEIKRCSEV